MTAKTHFDLALYLLRNITDFGSAFENAAFIIGCVEPDMNVTTYLKGSLSYQPLRGHNYPNTAHYIEALLGKMQRCEKTGILYCYRLGKLLHYLTDAFTYPHNQNFTGTLREHVLYEQKTEKVFESALSARKVTPNAYEANKLYEFFSSKHEEYMKQQPGAETDIQFILNVIPFVFHSLYIHASIAYRRDMECCESSLTSELVCIKNSQS